VRHLLRPLDDIGAGARRFGAGDFSQPIPCAMQRPDELGELAGTINTMGQDIRQMLDAKRALLLAISHELRSPLTRARLNTELLPETRRAAPARRPAARPAGLMRGLITDLLESERLASPHAALQREPVDVPALAQRCWPNWRPATRHPAANAAARRTGLPTLALDPSRMRLLLRNLLDNALRHGGTPPTRPNCTWHRRPRTACASRCATTAPASPRTNWPTWPSPSYRPTAPAPAPRAAWAWACTCASWWRRHTGAALRCAMRSPGWKWRCRSLSEPHRRQQFPRPRRLYRPRRPAGALVHAVPFRPSGRADAR
jgi:hypothetical protein